MNILRFVLSLSVLVSLGACGASSEEELQAWMKAQRDQLQPQATPVEAPKKFSPEPYDELNATEPFSKEKLLLLYKRDLTQSKNSALVAPELTRRKEAMESIPLDNMAMVGFMVKEGQPVALLKVANLLYKVKVGNYLGQSYGRVVSISESELKLREIAQDATGEWRERTTSLQLQEVSK